MTVGVAGFAPFNMNSVFSQSHYPWSADPNVLFCLVADQRYLSPSANSLTCQTLTQDHVSQRTVTFAIQGGGAWTQANNWGSRNLSTILGNGAQALQCASALINGFAAGTNTSYSMLAAGQLVSAPGAFHAFAGWTNSGLPSNDFALQRSDNLNPAHYVVVRAAHTGAILTATTTQTIDGNRHAVAYIFDGSGPSATVYLDNVVTSVNATPLSVGAISSTNLIFTVWASDATGLGNFSQLRTRTLLVYKTAIPANLRDAYSRFMLSELN